MSFLLLGLALLAGHAGPGYSANVDNPWFPLRPGTTFVYTGEKDGQPGRDVMTVTNRTITVAGAPCRVVDDRLYLRGRLAERTSDWYSQDSKGNVWYFGERTAEFDRKGKVTSREGSWQAGVAGARAGVLMPAKPRVGASFLEEYWKGHAEDHARITGLYGAGSKTTLLTEEWTPLEPAVLDHKLYIRGVGNVLEETVQGGSEHFALVSVKP
jgi:hypothetical protein